jgi:hypothetical protein
VVAKASGVSYREYVEKRILGPLGMKASTLEPSAVPEPVRAVGYGKSDSDYVEIPSLAHGSFGAMGGMLVSARDLAKYVTYQLSAWPPRDDADNGPVRRSSMREMQRVQRSSDFRVTRSDSENSVRVTAAGYGYGVRVSSDCRFQHMVSHGGGLPGFGSYMWWLPEYGVGMFAMTNLTYTAPTPAIDEAFDLLRKTGALRPRELPASAALISTRDGINKLWSAWDENQANAIAADNLFPDMAADVRRRNIERIKDDVGVCTAVSDVKPENLLRGQYRMTCARGFVDVSFTLAPTMPPKVQHLSFSTVKPIDERLKPVVDAALAKESSVLSTRYGTCRLGDVLSGNGRTQATLRVNCERGWLDLRLTADIQGKVLSTSFIPTSDSFCAR